MNPREFEAMNRQHGNHVDQTIEEATRLMLQLITNIEEDISPNEMSRHLKDVLSDAKQFVGIDIDSEYTLR